jgi:hypothetical protein
VTDLEQEEAQRIHDWMCLQGIPDTRMYSGTKIAELAAKYMCSAKPTMGFDAEFHAFQKLTALSERLLPNVRNYTVDQVDALHEYARTLARDLTSGKFIFDDTRGSRP